MPPILRFIYVSISIDLFIAAAGFGLIWLVFWLRRRARRRSRPPAARLPLPYLNLPD